MIDKGENYIDHKGREVYATSEMVETETKFCPKCKRSGQFQVTTTKLYDSKTDKIIEEWQDVYCGYGCELGDAEEVVTPKLDKKALKREIEASRARHIDNSIEVYNESDNPYLHGFNCLYIHWQEVEGGYSVFYDYYLEHGYQGRDKEVGKKEMLTQKNKPTSKQAKELLYAWMCERFDAMTRK